MIFSQMFRRFPSRSSKTPAKVTQSSRDIASAAGMAVESLEGRAYFSFAAPVAYTASAGPIAAISVDLNGDGRLDMVTTNSPGSVTALLGNGDGTFQAPKITATGAGLGSGFTGSQAGTLSSGDFNGDGKLDVATVSSQNVLIMLGNGDGTFGAPVASFLGTSPTRISTGDLNGDGKADLVAANTSGVVTVLMGNGDGTFAPAASYAAGNSPQDVKAVDMNHDGKPDLVVANAVSAGSVSVLIGNGDGTFQPYKSYAAFSAPYRMTVDDFNGDGNPDVAVANSYTSSCVTILYGNPDGTFQPYHSYNTGSQPWELHSADVDGDGKKDLISSNGTTYQIQLNNGDGTFAPSTSIAGAGLAFDAGDFNNDGVTDLGGASASSVGVMINTSPVATAVGSAVGFTVSGPATTATGIALPLTVTAVDVNGNPAADFLGTVHVTTTDLRATAQTYVFTATDAGKHTFSGLALYTPGSQTINIAGPGSLATSQGVLVTAGAAGRFSIVADATAIAGNTASFTVTAQDNYGNLAADYTGTVHFTSSDTQAGLPADYTFTAEDAGVHTFSATLKTAGPRTIAASDTLKATTMGVSSAVLVTPSTAASLGLIGGGGHIGSAHAVTVTARDAYGNLATGYNGTIHLVSSDAATIVSADAALVNGTGTFFVTPMTLGAQTLTATDATGLSATETITGTPGNASRFIVTPASGGVAGLVQNVTVTAYDSFGNLAVDYAGTVVLGSSDTQAALPTYTFTAADSGTHTFAISFHTAGTQTLTVRDYFNAGITATQTGITVTPAAAATMSVGLLHSVVAGTAQNVAVSVRDIYGNIATGYRGTMNFSTSDKLAVLLPSYTFTAVDAGTHTFSVTLKTSGGQTFTAQDTVTPAMTSFQRDIFVTPAALAGFTLRAPSNATAGVAFNVVLAATDVYGNTITGYTGKVHFTGPSGGGNLLPADYTFTAADTGSHTFSVTFTSTGTLTLGVADTLNSVLKTSTAIVVKTATTSGGTGGGGKKV